MTCPSRQLCFVLPNEALKMLHNCQPLITVWDSIERKDAVSDITVIILHSTIL